MATATKKARTKTHTGRVTLAASESVPMQFVIVEDNAGDYHWTLLDREGLSLGRSPSFSSYGDSENAARLVLASAGSAQLEGREGTDGPVDVAANAPSR